MYVGRIVAVGLNKAGNAVGMYRVSSRSFPNRETRMLEDKVAVMPKTGFEGDLSKNPYIAYNCIRIIENYAVISNGSHTDPIIEKIKMNMSPRDALTLSLLAMDFEKDHLDTPRIAGVITRSSESVFLGIVRRDAVLVREFKCVPGTVYYIATYEHNTPCLHYRDENFDIQTAGQARDYIFDKGVFSDFEKPVTSASVVTQKDGFELASEID